MGLKAAQLYSPITEVHAVTMGVMVVMMVVVVTVMADRMLGLVLVLTSHRQS